MPLLDHSHPPLYPLHRWESFHNRWANAIADVDTVTTRQANMHNELVRLLELEDHFQMPAESYLAAVAYRPARRGEANEIDVWAVALTIGGTLPVLPLALLGHHAIPLDLEATYTEARQRARLS